MTTILETLTARRTEVLTRLNELRRLEFPEVDEEAHRAAIAQAKVAALTGDPGPLEAAQQALDQARHQAAQEAPRRAAVEAEVSILTAELAALGEALEREEQARKARRKAAALAKFQAAAKRFDKHVRAALDELPAVVAAAVVYSGNRDMQAYAREIVVPDFSGAIVDEHGGRLAHVPLLRPDPHVGNDLMPALLAELEGVA